MFEPRSLAVSLAIAAMLTLTFSCTSTTQQTGIPADTVADAAVDGEEEDTWVPPPVAVAVAVGQAHVCALMSDDVVKCWGSNGKGQLGRGLPPSGTDADKLPEPEPTTELSTPIAIVAAWLQTCALHEGGKASCWGANEKGQLGNGKDTMVYGVDNLAAEVEPDAVQNTGGIKSFAMGKSHGCVVGTDKRVRCWGGNEFGQLGNNKALDSRKPDFVKMAAGQVAVAAGEAHTCAANKDGSVRCWGKGADGRLGHGADTDSPSPQEVQGLSDATALVAGRAHNCALRTGGKVSCWGAGDKGQLGDGSGKSANKAVEVVGLSDVTALAAGSDHTCALVSGALHCWGGNDFGQLGQSTKSVVTKPEAVAGLGTVVAFDAGGGTTCVLSDEDKVQCWGDNSSGQLGSAASGPVSAQPVLITFPVPVVEQPDAGPTDGGMVDTTQPDAGGEDAGKPDVGPPIDAGGDTDGGSTQPSGGVVYTESGEVGTNVIVQADDSKPNNIWPGGVVVAPPGGGRILFFLTKKEEMNVSDANGFNDIIVAGSIMEPTGHGALSPNGNKVAYLKGKGSGAKDVALGTITSKGTDAYKLASDVSRASAVAFSPGSDRLAWYSATGEVRATVNGFKNPKPLNNEALPFGTPAVVSSLGWSPKGDKVVFTIKHKSDGGPVSSDIAVVGADGSGLVRLTNDAILDVELAVAKDGTVWFQRIHKPEVASEIWQVTVDGGLPKKVMTTGTALQRLPQPSGDGHKVLYISSTGYKSGALTSHNVLSGKGNIVSQAAVNGFWL